MDYKFMEEAFKYAKIAYDFGEVPVGAVIVKDNKIVSYGFNEKEHNNSVFSHAELTAIRNAEKLFNNWRLDDCDIYVTLDPCPMCASAIKQSRIKNVYSALQNSDMNNKKILTEIFSSDFVNPSVNYFSNLDPERSKNLLSQFFKNRREK